MLRRSPSVAATIAAALLVALGLLAPAPGAQAGLGDALKKKLAEKATKKAEAAVDKAAEAGSTPDAGAKPPAASEGDAPAAAGKPGGKVSSVSTKFDYVPGDSVILVDDFRLDELGEFPARWTLQGGTFEVAEDGGERWLRCTSVDGRVRMKLPAPASLPEYWTLEFDFACEEPMGSALTVAGYTAAGHAAWEAVFPQGRDLAFRSGSIFSTTPLEGDAPLSGRRHVMLMARGPMLKVYLDRQRMANVPDVHAAAGAPTELEIRLWAPSGPRITNVRFASGCRPPKDLLESGRLVTYGIHFASGSDVVLPESAPVLRQVAAYLAANPAVRLRITGHTDNVGKAPDNLELSKRRSASVAKVLAGEFAIAPERLETDGKGDTQAIASNAKPEGRATNRRVEFTKP